MIITWLGHSCFKIQDKLTPEGVTVVTDPFDKSVGLKVPRFEANIVTISHDHSDHNNVSAIKGNPFIIRGAGEYEVDKVFIEGVEAYHSEDKKEKNIIYRIDIDEMSVTHLGDLGHTLDAKQLEQLEGTDILLIPVGENFTIGAKKAVEVVSQIEPRIVIPMHYKIPGLTVKLEDAQKFIKELGIKPTHEEKLKISKRDLPTEEMELVVLSV